ncbi:UDP-glucose 4-epimerase GalE [Roseinatronobacter bogoriensis]|uniref:UDP-glucose 4-epimerase n=1 Tax=Roseinatronobacter bogoriensis subsp. barguzinensis TaxID=441209 RepID=A0A2K8KDK7_9RHOB|nr:MULTISPECIES: UDP-glucose 4-epimerase GalE [Rhodobaca]ATX67511.1 UDP-glucose 4-epimerase GalE [Rhodobaca barguzinensis]MBB4207105.1 UDP-glucose 4-epimerase [Rhodobaca bogoriensis DSM 18756]TDW35965.1 UDP-glucose 4-epimerase [Rhodobaca barguzinensis]TDY73978.1 UDP-galactose 4-epimerase [Rhodobaca bogoriensis DSM 18756]
MSTTPKPVVLVTGGAGYIGSHACKALARAGFSPVVFDNLSTGWAKAVKFGPLVQGDLLDRAALDAAFTQYRPEAVMHFAALSQVGEATRDPGKYWRNNLVGSLNLVEAMLAHECRKMVFSSTCATYGDQDGVTLDEDSAQRPLNAYGASKLAVEGVLRDFGVSHGLNAVIFRYFNVAGADPEAEIGEWHQPETHLIPVMLEALAGARDALTLHGADYPTPDGTCIRDYVHVTDLVDAHIRGLDWLRAGRGSRVFNLGTGHGFSVAEVLAAARAVMGREVPHVIGPRRAGDAAALVSGSARAHQELGWEAQNSTLERMISDAQRWYQTGGY